jgi:HSP20 family protein
MGISRWDSLREMEELLERHARTRPATRAAGEPMPPGRSEHLASADWQPVVDVSETATAYLIEAELPGIRKEDVRVSVDAGVLTVQGQREPANDRDKRRYHRRERASGHFTRSFALPEDADIDHIAASFEAGMLAISVAKLAQRRNRGVEISLG